jgi:hypothetical protein
MGYMKTKAQEFIRGIDDGYKKYSTQCCHGLNKQNIFTDILYIQEAL